MARIAVLFNSDYDDGAAPDVASVLVSARALADALRAAGHAVELVGVRGIEELGRLRASPPDLAFNLCESAGGESRHEPIIAGLLDLFGIWYTGSDALALASCVHKQRAKEILIAHGVPTPPHRFVRTASDLDDRTLDALDYPWFVKLAHEDASLGITEANVVGSPAELRARALELFREFRQPVLAERFVDGREINVTLVGNRDAVDVLPLFEIDFAAMPVGRPRILSYAAKWQEDHVDYAGTKPVAAKLAGELIVEIERVARAAWRALELRDYGRVDLRIDRDGKPWVIDVNPNPDLSPDAGVARTAAAAGMTYEQLVARIAELAMQRKAS
jgi:D-alanine-D-alanine ligase